jgi:hypothetical protein
MNDCKGIRFLIGQTSAALDNRGRRLDACRGGFPTKYFTEVAKSLHFLLQKGATNSEFR